MQRLRTHGATIAGEMKQQATQQSPRRQTAMMARHFTTGHCADALILALGYDASMLAAPSNAASSMPSALHSLPPVLPPQDTFPEPWIPPLPPPPPDLRDWGQSTAGAPRAAGTS
jgi:hypothetical protein